MADIIRTSILDGELYHMEIPGVSTEDVVNFLTNTNAPYIQDAFPNLDAGQREFILTGVTPEEWDKVMGEEEE